MPNSLLSPDDKKPLGKLVDRKLVGNYSVADGKQKMTEIGFMDTRLEELNFAADLAHVLQTVQIRTQHDLGKVKGGQEITMIEKMKHKGIFVEQKTVRNQRFASTSRDRDNIANKSAVLRTLPTDTLESN